MAPRSEQRSEVQAAFCESAIEAQRPCGQCYGCVGWERASGDTSLDTTRLVALLAEAVDWARRPSPIPIVPFNDFLNRCGEVGVGPRAERPSS